MKISTLSQRMRWLAIMLAVVMASAATRAANYAWPANYEGVMLQGFYWDSYDDTKWTNLEAQADELSQSFKLIWVPNSARCGSQREMGYSPVYWFTNHNTAFGTQAQLKSMIQTFKAKGTGIIEDVVINHRNGTTNWTNFPTETWNGQTWKIGPEGICRNDEVANASGQATPTGNYDTGENFDGARDLDHTNANVQNNCKNYCKFLLEDLGYAGFRLDMVKGYDGQYTKLYNEYAKPTYCVGEYWDGNYDAVAGWIERTGRQSAAFDFPGKYAINEAFHSGDMTKLVWKANGTTDQPAGLIHFGYSQYAVTFIDNHDTYRDGSKFNGNVVAANAFILCSPGTPCVFLPHWKAHKAELKQIIALRNAAGLHNNSAVKVLRSSRDCYMAEVTGTKGKLVVKIGSAQVSPDGYSNADIKASGNDYCIWSKVGGVDPNPPTPPVPGDDFTVYFDNSNSNWATPYIHYWGASESTWPGVAMTKTEGKIWQYTVPAGTTGLLFNAGDGDATKTADFVAVANHVYNTSGDQGEYGDDPTPPTPPVPGNMPSELYVLGNLSIGSWDTTKGIKMTRKDYTMVAENVTLVNPTNSDFSYFTFVTTLGADWDAVNGGDRYGAPTADAPVTLGQATPFQLYAVNVSASSAKSWKIAEGIYKMVLDFSSNNLTVTSASGALAEVEAETEDVAPVYYNLQGIRVAEPTSGLYIVVRGAKVSKEYLR